MSCPPWKRKKRLVLTSQPWWGRELVAKRHTSSARKLGVSGVWTNLGHHGNPFSNRHCLYLSTPIPPQLARVISFYQASLPCLSPLPATVTLSAILAGIHPNAEFSHRLFICLFIYFFRQGLDMYSVLASRAQSSCLTFPSTGIIGVCHLAWSPTLF